MNGDGDAEIIACDGINKFDCDDYNHTVLFSKSNKVEYFDYVISNPPYSVDGFMQNFRRNGINENSNTFTLLDCINPKDQRIEIFFVERAEQLLKNGDILISSLVPCPQKIVVAKDDFKLSGAIFVLSSFKNDAERDFVLERLKSADAIEQMCAMLDGFKITYAKISEHNLYNNVMI